MEQMHVCLLFKRMIIKCMIGVAMTKDHQFAADFVSLKAAKSAILTLVLRIKFVHLMLSWEQTFAMKSNALIRMNVPMIMTASGMCAQIKKL